MKTNAKKTQTATQKLRAPRAGWGNFGYLRVLGAAKRKHQERLEAVQESIAYEILAQLDRKRAVVEIADALGYSESQVRQLAARARKAA